MGTYIIFTRKGMVALLAATIAIVLICCEVFAASNTDVDAQTNSDRITFIENLGYKVAEETRENEGGFVIKKGDIEYNYSFESIISVEKEDIDQAAAKILFA